MSWRRSSGGHEGSGAFCFPSLTFCLRNWRTDPVVQSRGIAGGLGAIDRSFEGGKYKKWPPFPWFVPYLVYFWIGRKYKGSWRFSPCSYWGVPRELPFAKEESM